MRQLLLLLLALPAHAQVGTLISAKRERHCIAALVTHADGANFLVRSHWHWLHEETLVAVIDAPSDEWTFFSQDFRASPRYGEDIRQLLAEVGHRYSVAQWTFVGTSEGSVSAFHAARMNPALARRLVLTSSL